MPAAIPIAAAVVGGVISSDASRKASNTQADAANNAAANSKEQQAQIRSDLMPYNYLGQNAGAKLSGLLGTGGDPNAADYGSLTKNFTAQDYLNNKDPGYQFQLQQGQNALQNSQAAKSGVLSGAALKGLIGYNQGMASTGYQDAFNRQQTQNTNTYNRLSSLLGIGENAAAQSGNMGAQLTGNANALTTGAANATASGIVGQANALSGAVGSAAGGYMYNKMLGGGGVTGDTGYSNPFTGYGGYEGQVTDGGGLSGGVAGDSGVFSDIRLKKNIKLIGGTDKGNNVYSWDWKNGSGCSIGVIAQEVMHIPGAVFSDPATGFLKVIYSKV